ncbi:hypothetical protein D3C77_561880 [compost metagenome]
MLAPGLDVRRGNLIGWRLQNQRQPVDACQAYQVSGARRERGSRQLESLLRGGGYSKVSDTLRQQRSSGLCACFAPMAVGAQVRLLAQ